MRLPSSYALRPDPALSPAAALWETLGYLGSAFKFPKSARARTTLRLDRHRLLPLTTLAWARQETFLQAVAAFCLLHTVGADACIS